MAVLVKTESVLEITRRGKHEVVFEHSDRFADAKDRSPHCDRVFHTSKEDWEEWGSPETITISIEFKDTLNAE